jgi:predicted O-linked N-acetylglucosamine transferase (SPINDLY family)
VPFNIFALLKRRIGKSSTPNSPRTPAACPPALERPPDPFEALLLSADIAAKQRDLDGAIKLCTTAIDLKPDQPLAYYKRGNWLRDNGEMEAALASYDQAIALDPGYANAFCNRGVVLERLERLEEARRSYDQAIALNSGDALAYYNRGVVLRALSRSEEALASFDLAIAARPDYSEAYCNRGILLAELRQWDGALASYGQCIASDPDFHQAHFNRGALLKERGEPDAALASYDRAIEVYPDYAEAYCNRGVVLTELGRWDEAVASFDRAISIKSDFAEAYGNRADALLHMNRFQEAIASFDQAIILKPDLRFMVGARRHARMNLCDWQDFDADSIRLASAIEADLAASPPFYILGLLDSPALQRKAAETWVREYYPADASLGPVPRRTPREKLRIGYFSADFREHATAHLLAQLIDIHDRSRFDVFGFSFGPNTEDRYRKRLECAFDRFLDVRTSSDLQVALLARDLGVDIAVDLGGHTHLSRTGVFALRAAPLQVNYLGYPGTMGATYMDYVIADRTLVPPGAERHFAEQIIYLPDSYQVNDSTRSIANRHFSRSELGLPTEGFVFCCFNNSYKILPATFEGWMRILKQVPGSVLWLLESYDTATSNLRQKAIAASVDPARLIFTKRLTPSDHLARHRAADLFLDTLPYNAHTTASDALWAGLPLLTCSGASFASRVAASLLRAVGLPELIAATQEQYEQLAIELASNPPRMAELKNKLADYRLTQRLFDSRSFAKNLEAAYVNIYGRYQANLPPTHIEVTASAT